MQLYQAGYKYIADVGKVKQSSHKAQSSIIKGVTEEVKVQHSVVDFDVANIELEQKLEKRNQAEETLKQEQIKTVAAINETDINLTKSSIFTPHIYIGTYLNYFCY